MEEPVTSRGRSRSLVVAAVALGLAGALTTVGLVALRTVAGEDTAAATQAHSSPRAGAPATSTTTTELVIERVTLAPGEREVATARPGVGQVAVRSTAPPGWDTALTPVVVAASGDTPPRTGADVDRMALPSPDTPVAGRVATADGWSFANPGLYTPAQPLVFSVVSRQGPWVQVLLPVRPNGTTGWLHADQVELSTTTSSVQVSLSARNLRVVDGATVVLEAPISVGRPASPTPTGEFYVTDVVPSVDPAGPYGPVALALNGYSEVMDRFGSSSVAGSPDELAPVLAIHGTNQPGSIGRPASNGCPRLYDDDMLVLAALVPAGTPVEIWP